VATFRLKVFRNRVLKETFGPKGEEVTMSAGKGASQAFVSPKLKNYVYRILIRRIKIIFKCGVPVFQYTHPQLWGDP
jgi:hypothetical protein